MYHVNMGVGGASAHAREDRIARRRAETALDGPESGDPGRPGGRGVRAGPMRRNRVESTALSEVRATCTQLAVDRCVRFRRSFLDLTLLQLKSVPTIPSHVRTLWLEGNFLRTLSSGLPPGLCKLDVSDNHLTSIPGGLPDTIRYIRASRNWISEIQRLPNQLESLDIKGNVVQHLPREWPAGLLRLDASSNQLAEYPPHLPRGLRSLNVSNNLIKALPDSLSSALTTLRIDGNKDLRALSPSLPPRLKWLSACDCDLSELPKAWPASLRVLLAADNRLSRISSLPRSLQVLDVSGNEIEAIDIKLPHNLRTACLSNNRLLAPPRFVTTWRDAPDAVKALSAKSRSRSGLRVDLTNNPCVSGLTQSQLHRFHCTHLAQDGLVVYTYGSGMTKAMQHARNTGTLLQSSATMPDANSSAATARSNPRVGRREPTRSPTNAPLANAGNSHTTVAI